METASKILSELIIYMKYAKYIPEKQRRESWTEVVTRNKEMHTRKFPELKKEINAAYKLVYNKEVLPSMRSLQFGGKPIEINPARINNCAYIPIDSWEAFNETMFLLLGGTGVGYSVQMHHVSKLPEIVGPHPKKTKRYLIGDSIEGWADAIKILMKSYFFGGHKIKFDYSDIRSKGERLVTSGGKAPGPQPLKECMVKIKGILETAKESGNLTTVQCHDILCHIADAVLSGGIRRAAMIAFFSLRDDEMFASKTGNWWEINPQRGRANNSVVFVRSRVKKENFEKAFQFLKASRWGEPGIYFTNDKDMLSNPCGEIGLKPYSFCNLSEINASTITTQEDLNERVKSAAFLGTLQASYTDFHYLREIWKEATERDALIGVSLTGIASNKLENIDLEEGAKLAIEENKRVAELIGINPAKRVTTIKPAGTSSIVLGCSSGIHAWHSQYYIRRIRLNKEENMYKYLNKKNSDLIEDDFFRPHDTAVLSIPQKAPVNAITRDEKMIELLDRISTFFNKWVVAGHVDGPNTNNVSATVSVKDGEWDIVKDWLWTNRKNFNGISLLPFDGGTYQQPPFESCSPYIYNKLLKSMISVDFTKIKEEEDNTDLKGELACHAGQCEVT